MHRIIIALLLFCSLNTWADPKELIYQNFRLNIEALSQWSLADSETINGIELGPQNTFSQKLDHENEKETRTFNQRYWISKSNSSGENAPTIFYICGEGACSSSGIYSMAGHARELGASVVSLEHRYYGQSQPFEDLSTENLKYLTVNQALKDLVEFKKYAAKKYQLNGPWIVVGGSYPGALSAYARAKYPNEFVGSLASSAPVMADNDFSEYDRHVAKVAGKSCLLAVQKAVKEIEDGIETPEGFASLKAQFDASALRDKDDFLYLIADTGAAAVQYGMRNQFCDLVENQGVVGYARAAQLVANLFGNLVNLSVQAAEDTSVSAHNGQIGMRQWLYQSCTEFGYWQNAWPDQAESARSARINEAYHKNVCKRLFHLDEMANVEKTNRAYLAPILESETKQILFTNGEQDPWLNLSITDLEEEGMNKNLSVMVIPGAAHCDDLGSSASSPEVRKAQRLFLSLSQDWLNNP